mgnify:CR=1 FL=1
MRKILLAELFCMLAITVQAQFVTIMGETETVVNDTVSTDFNPTDQYDFDEEDDDEDDTVSTNCTAENLTNNTTANTSDNTKPNSGVYVVSEVVKYNYQADDGSYYREVTYSDGGFRQYNTSSGKLIGSSYASDQKYLPSME